MNIAIVANSMHVGGGVKSIFKSHIAEKIPVKIYK
jgi:hypothetical protein